jgi:hypothetical protein
MGFVEAAIEALSFIALLLGSLLLVALLISAIIIVIVLALLAYSLKTGTILLPNLMINGIVFFESPLKAVARLFGVDDSRIDRLAIRLKNRTICQTYRKIPYEKRAVFVPQCLRSVNCPAVLSPEGIKCKDCGACGISEARKEAKRLGLMFFIVPGSSFIVRLIKKYRPGAIIGVGCLCEVKEGLDMMHRYKIPAMGVILERSGCVATTLNWEKLYEIMRISDVASPEQDNRNPFTSAEEMKTVPGACAATDEP